jgi:arginase family enzyme
VKNIISDPACQARIFGAALEFNDDPERLGLKLAFLDALADGRIPPGLPADPYDAIAPALKGMLDGCAELEGRIEVPGWLTPRPGVKDRRLVSAERYRAFMDEGGPRIFVTECERMAEGIFPAVPVMIGVDHCLAAGPIRAASRQFGPENLAVVVLDQHFDAVPARSRSGEAGLGWESAGWCGDFLMPLLREGVVLPSRLFVLGVCDHPGKDAADTRYGREYLSWIEKGVRIFTRDEAMDAGFAQRLEREISGSGARYMYVSLDADVGAAEGMSAVRFLDRPGIPAERVIEIASWLRRIMDEHGIALAGVDTSEVDVHLLGLSGPEGKDRTAEICAGFIATLLGRHE